MITSIETIAQKETRQVNGFDEVSMGISGDLYLKQGSSTSLELQGDDDDLEDVITEVKNGKLVIKYRNNIQCQKKI